MPKIIPQVKETLISEMRNQVLNNGYSATTVRSVASACNIAVRTVYNYFDSKDKLIFEFMLSDWEECMEAIQTRIDNSKSKEEKLNYIYNGMRLFSKYHGKLFVDEEAITPYCKQYAKKHPYVLKQIGELLSPLLNDSPEKDNPFLMEFVTGTLISYAIKGTSFTDYYSVIKHLL